MNRRFETIDEYIGMFPADVQTVLERVRQTIRRAAPGVVETISYQMPTFKLNGRNLVHFGGWERHIGFYPAPSGMTSFDTELSGYVRGKGSVQFPLDRPIPFGLIEKIVTFRVQEELARAKTKKTRKVGQT